MTNPYPHHTDDTVEPAPDAGRADLVADRPASDTPSEELAEAPPRRRRARTTVALAAAVLLIGGFAGGVEIEKRWGSGAATTAAGPAAGILPRAQASAGTAGPAGPGPTTDAGTITGTVKLVDGDTVYITTPQGQTVVVKTSSTTTVATAQGASLKDLTAGSTVSIQGQTGSDGGITATTITRAR
jgi:hypothetical protein